MKTARPKPTASRIPSKWRQNHQKLQALRETLRNTPARQRPLVPAPQFGAPATGPAVDLDHHLTLGILALEEDALAEVESALERLEKGTYGICERSGRPIPEARLQVVPWTRYTRESLEKFERQEMQARWNQAMQRPQRGNSAGFTTTHHSS